MNQVSIQNILIIDDSEDMQALLEMLLIAKGYRTQCTSNGSEARFPSNACSQMFKLKLTNY